MTAAWNGNLRIVKLLLDYDAQLNAHDAEHETALHGAVMGGHVEVVRFLLEQGIVIDSKGIENGTPLEMARNTGQRTIEKLLTGEDMSDEESVPISESQPAQPTDSVKVDTAKEAEIDPTSEDLISQYLIIMLVVSAANGKTEDVLTLLDAQVDPNSKWDQHGSALYAACLNGHLETVQLLLENGAEVNGPEGEIGSPLHAACYSGSLALVILLLAWGANLNGLHLEYGYPLHVSSAAGHIPIMRLLVEAFNFPIDAWGGKYGTSLIAAATAGLAPSAYLISKGANIHFRSPTGFGIIDMARVCGHQDAKAFFTQCGAKSSGWLSAAGLVSRLGSLSLKLDRAMIEVESQRFIQRNFAATA